MTLFTKPSDKFRDEALSKILANSYIIAERFDSLSTQQKQTNILLEGLIRAVAKQADSYGEFINVIQNFFAIQKKLSIEESKRKAEREAEFDLTEADKKY